MEINSFVGNSDMKQHRAFVKWLKLNSEKIPWEQHLYLLIPNNMNTIQIDVFKISEVE